MTIPFLDLFNKLRARFVAPEAPIPTPATARRSVHTKKPEEQHFRKTVLPNTTRSFAPPDPFRAASGAKSPAGGAPQFGPANVLSPTGPTISRARDLPRALALALEPKVERVISLPLGDFIDQVPAEFIKPIEVIDASHVVALKASEIEKGMPEHNPTVSLASLYQQAPEIFLRTVMPSDTTRVSLPYAKILEQFSSARVRDDQERDQRVPQFDTPILQATIKDTERFGTTIQPLESSDSPPVPVRPATAEAFASAEPEPIAYGTPQLNKPGASASPPYPVISLRSSEPEPEIEPTTAEAFASMEPETIAPEKARPADPKTPPPYPVISLHSSEPKPEIKPRSAELFASTKPETTAPEKAKPADPQAPPPYPVISLRSSEPEPEIKPRSAEPFASTKPETTTPEKPKPTDPKAPPPYPVISLRSSEAKPQIERTTPPETIEFDFPPNGTGAPASERVPASSGPPVPNISPPPTEPKGVPFEAPLKLAESKIPEASAPASKPPSAPSTPPVPAKPVSEVPGPSSITIEPAIPARAPTPIEAKAPTPATPVASIPTAPTVPSAPAKPSTPVSRSVPSLFEQIPLLLAAGEKEVTPEAAAIPEEKETKSDPSKVVLGLKPVLQNVPAFQLHGDTNAVAEDVRIEFPLSLVQSQLAGGRVTVPAKLFKETLPEKYRDLFVMDPGETPVSLPLQEVLKNIPADALRIRADQEDQAPAKQIPTPFSKRAEEDAKRFEESAAVSRAMEKESTSKPQASTKEATGDVAPAEKIDGKEVVTQACRISGVSACEITFPDGLSLAGNFPTETGAEGLCAMAPMVLQRINQHMSESRFGALTAMTLHSANSSITFFMKGSICVAALHEEEGALAPEARAQLEQLTEKLSRIYSQPERPHVDH